MTIYIIIFFVLLLFSLIDIILVPIEKKARIIMMSIAGVIIVTIAGLRWDTGTDWFNYSYYFHTIDQRSWARSGMEIGYEILVRVNKYLFGPYTVFLFTCAAFIVSLTYFVTFRLSPKPLLSLFILWGYSMVASGFGVRQDIAIAITLVATLLIIKRYFWGFAVLVIIASTIHQTSIIYLPAYFLFHMKWDAFKIVLILIAFLILIAIAPLLILYIGPMLSESKTEFYMEAARQDSSLGGVIKSVFTKLIFFAATVGFVKYKGDNKDDIYNGLFNLYVISIFVYVTFAQINPVFGRLARFYEIFQAILLAMAFAKANLKGKIIVFSLVFMLSSLKFYTALTTKPGNIIYVPYKTIFKY